MDFISGLKEIEADTYDEPPPRNKAERFWQWLVSTRLLSNCLERYIDAFRRCEKGGLLSY